MNHSGQISKAVLHMIGSIFLYIMSYMLLYIALRSFHVDVCMIQMLSSCLVIYYSYKRAKKKKEDYFGDCGFKRMTLTKKDVAVLAGLGFSLNCAVGGIINLLPLSPELAKSYREMAAAPVEGVKPLLAFFIIAFCAPVVEEVFFRGTVLRRMCKDMNPLSALALLSLAFGALHGQIIWIVYAVILGLILGLTWLLTESIYPCILVHMSFNLVSGIPMLLNPSSLVYRLTYGNRLFLILMAAGGSYGVVTIIIRYYFPKFMESGLALNFMDKQLPASAEPDKEA